MNFLVKQIGFDMLLIKSHRLITFVSFFISFYSGVTYAEPVQKVVFIPQSNAEVVIDLNRFEHNLNSLKGYIAKENSNRNRQAKVCAIMKGDAYGHGLKTLLPSVIEKGIPCIGIASNEDAKVVREGGFKGRLLRVRAATEKEMAEAVIKFGTEELVGSVEQALSLAKIGKENSRVIPFHLALNSAGMGRNGLDVSTADGRKDAARIVNFPNTKLVGMMTHFPADASTEILDQFKREANGIISDNGLIRDEITLHIANSGATLALPETHLDMVRPGRLLYGLISAQDYLAVLTFRTNVASLHRIKKDTTVGYASTETVKKGAILANIPVGFSDGYPFGLSRTGVVLVKGQRAKVVGRVSMNTTMVDVSHIDNVSPGDEVVLFGEQGDDSVGFPDMKADAYYVTIWGKLNPIRNTREPIVHK